VTKQDLPSSFIDIIKNINSLENFGNVICGCCEDVKGHVVDADILSPFSTQEGNTHISDSFTERNKQY
jgi:hypothetical protein